VANIQTVICPYCSKEAKLVDSSVVYRRSYGMIWYCKPCDAYVGVHKNSKDHKPMGNLANWELRSWRMRVHEEFDKLWRSGKIERKEAYGLIQTLMNMTPAEAHIGKFNVEQCKRLWMALTTPKI